MTTPDKTPTVASEEAEKTVVEKVVEAQAAQSAVLREAEQEAGAVPEGAAPDRLVAEDTVTEEPKVSDSDTSDDSVTAVEDASDAELRAWAKDNGVEGVPASGKLSVSWRDQITAAMAAALDPKAEASAEAASDPNVVYVDRIVEVPEYRTPYEVPDTWVSSQAYTA